ncbi:MAG: hypothetical protein HN348_27945 [Proteobacteria bacterium]|jgi:hypothetical protein|nr:hypothetical protein [Pseudomonadota bacterium]
MGKNPRIAVLGPAAGELGSFGGRVDAIPAPAPAAPTPAAAAMAKLLLGTCRDARITLVELVTGPRGRVSPEALFDAIGRAAGAGFDILVVPLGIADPSVVAR